MSTVSLPSTFFNSFWTQDYRTGLHVLYAKLDQGFAEDQQILAFITTRSHATRAFALALLDSSSTGSSTDGFEKDEGAGLRFCFKGIEDQSRSQAQLYLQTAQTLAAQVALPYDKWSTEHKARVLESKKVVLDWVQAWEKQTVQVNKLRVTYHDKARDAELAEAEARFSAPESPSKSTTEGSDPSSPPPPAPSEDTLAPKTHAKKESDDIPLAQLHPQTDKRPLKPLVTIPPSAPEPPVHLANHPLSSFQFTQLLAKARATLPQRTVQVPFLGEYHGCFTGDDLVVFLSREVREFGGRESEGKEAGRELVEVWGAVKRVGLAAIGGLKGRGSWGGGGDEIYMFTDKQIIALSNNPTSPSSPLSSAPSLSFIQRSSTLVNSLLGPSLSSSSFKSPTADAGKARDEANEAEREYKDAVGTLDAVRCRMEEVVEEALKILGRWEGDRLKAIKTVLTEYQRVTQQGADFLQPSLSATDLLLQSYVPDADFQAMIARYRTGAFRPAPEIFEPFSRDLSHVVFGGNLQRWADGTGWSIPKDLTQGNELAGLPPVLSTLLKGLREGYPSLETDHAKRMVWIYDVPLSVSHRLRNALQEALPAALDIPAGVLQKDLPSVAATVRLWLLELNPPLGPDWEDVKVAYPSVGAGTERQDSKLKIEELKSLLSRLAKIKLIVLNGVIAHLRKLIDDTKAEEAEEIYITKVSLSLGRTIVRPEKETALSIEDRAPSAFVADLLRYYTDVFPPVIASRQQEAERIPLQRKATRPIDRRVSRSNMTEEERVELQAQITHGVKPTISAPSSPKQPLQTFAQPIPAPRGNENSARLETDEQIKEHAIKPTPKVVSKRISLGMGKLRTPPLDEPLPAGFNLTPPTPISSTSPDSLSDRHPDLKRPALETIQSEEPSPGSSSGGTNTPAIDELFSTPAGEIPAEAETSPFVPRSTTDEPFVLRRSGSDEVTAEDEPRAPVWRTASPAPGKVKGPRLAAVRATPAAMEN